MMIRRHNYNDFSETMQRCHDYIKALEEERRKIQVFQRELPLCLELVTQAIETCKQHLSGSTITTPHEQSESSEKTSSDAPVFEEFIPLKRALSDSDGETESKINDSSYYCNNEGKNSICKKSDWLRSVQLWNQTTDPPASKELSSSEFIGLGVKGNGGGGAFHPLKKEKGAANDTQEAPASTSSTAENSGENKKDERERQSQRKARRCWSPELHRRFLQALQQLGGSHVATPKQIRELMKADGLTNDEVKSHLQKYRLHTRRPIPSLQNNNAQTPQFVMAGGLWVPPEYATNTKSAAHTPIAVPPPSFQEPPQHIKPSSESNDRGRSFSKGGTQSCSPATSTSTHTTAAVSPAAY